MHSLTGFILKAIEISRVDYEPSDVDILYAEGITFSNGIASVEFSFPQSVQDSYMDTTDHHDPLKRLLQVLFIYTSCTQYPYFYKSFHC